MGKNVHGRSGVSNCHPGEFRVAGQSQTAAMREWVREYLPRYLTIPKGGATDGWP